MNLYPGQELGKFRPIEKDQPVNVLRRNGLGAFVCRLMARAWGAK